MHYIFDLIIIGVVAFFMVIGARKGFVKSAIEIVGYILAFLIAFSVSNYVADYVYENKIKESVISSVSEIGKNSVENVLSDSQETADKVWDALPSYITALPTIDKEGITDFVETNIEKRNESIDELAISISGLVVKPIVTSAIKIIASIILIILLLFVVKFLAKLIGGLFNKSIFKVPNRFLGGLLGAVKGLVICAALLVIFINLLPLLNVKMGIETDKTFIFKYLYEFIYRIKVI
ncbi:MAG: CvpA family protein [Clostridia bacterium]|nr:CvpA family protein [Clostridia bacterium]